MGSQGGLLSIAHRFRFTEAEYRARREVFERSISLDPVARISLAEKHSVLTIFVVPALEELVRRTQPLLEREIAHISSETVARLSVSRERYLRQSSRMFASETWLKRLESRVSHRETAVAYRGCIDFGYGPVDGQVYLIRYFSCMRIQQHVLHLYRTNGFF